MPSEKTLKTIVIVLGVALLGGFAVLVGTIITRAIDLGGGEEAPDAAPANGRIDLILNRGAGTKLLKQSQNEDYIVLVLEEADGTQSLIIFDAKTRELLGYFPLQDPNEDTGTNIKIH